MERVLCLHQRIRQGCTAPQWTSAQCLPTGAGGAQARGQWKGQQQLRPYQVATCSGRVSRWAGGGAAGAPAEIHIPRGPSSSPVPLNCLLTTLRQDSGDTAGQSLSGLRGRLGVAFQASSSLLGARCQFPTARLLQLSPLALVKNTQHHLWQLVI